MSTTMTDGGMSGNVLSLPDAYKKIEELQSGINFLQLKLQDYVTTRTFIFGPSQYNGMQEFKITIPEGYKRISGHPYAIVSGIVGAFTQDSYLDDNGTLQIHVTNPNNASVSVLVEVFFIKT